MGVRDALGNMSDDEYEKACEKCRAEADQYDDDQASDVFAQCMGEEAFDNEMSDD